jgi:hypothetical protein
MRPAFALVLLACAPRLFCTSVTRCNLAPWYGDQGLVTNLIIQESSASRNSSWPDCLEVCSAQLMLHTDVASGAVEHASKDAFLACCVWFRQQLSGKVPVTVP